MAHQVRILLVDDSVGWGHQVRVHLEDAGLDVDVVQVWCRASFTEGLGAGPWDIVLCELELPGLSAREVLMTLAGTGLDLPCMILTSSSAEALAVEAMRQGARDFVSRAQLHRLAPAIEREVSDAKMRLQARLATRQLRQSRYALERVAQSHPDGLWDWDLDADTVYYSPHWKQMLGFEEHEIGCSPDEWTLRVHPEDLSVLQLEISKHLSGLTPHINLEHRLRDRHNTWRWVQVRGSATQDDEGRPVRVSGTAVDVTGLKLAEERLAHAAAHDALTGLPNRALFMDRLGHAIGRYHLAQSQRFAVLFIAMDRFGAVVDSLGHVAADKLLVRSARRIAACLRPGDTVARFGDNVFSVLVEDVDVHLGATDVAARIQESLSRPVRLKGVDVFSGASIGVKLGGGPTQTAEDLMRDADAALSQAKRLGGGKRSVFDTTMAVAARERLILEAELRHALERQELVPSYQPIVCLATGEVVGAEVLVRWQHPTRGLLLPVDFLQVAEDTGLVTSLDWMMFELATQQLRVWNAELGHTRLKLSLNLSGRHFGHADLVAQVSALCEKAGVSPGQLKLEITETAILDDSEATADQLLRLREMGCHLCLDDFGTGYSPLGNLYRLPIDTLKIDRSFVSHMNADPRKAEIVRTIVCLAKNLDKAVIAEGVETAAQRERLVGMSCELGQGWLFSRAIDSSSMGALLRSKQHFGLS